MSKDLRRQAETEVCVWSHSDRMDAYLTAKNLARHLFWPTKLCSALCKNSPVAQTGRSTAVKGKRKETHNGKT